MDFALSRTEQTLIAGGLAGSIAKTATAPLSRLTILYQVQHLIGKSGGHFKSYSMKQPLFSVIRDIYQQEGLLSFWRGNLTAVIHRFPYSAVNFTVYDFVKNTIKSDFGVSDSDNAAVRLLSGAAAGSVACTACYPLDLVRTRLSIAGDYHGIISTLRRVATEEGYLGLYCGLSAALAVAVPQIAINYSAYGALKGGAMSGMVASLLTFPSDVLRRRLQMRGVTVHGVRISALTEIKKVYKHGGLRGFYTGIVPELLKVIPMVSITFFVFESVADSFGMDHEL